MARHRKLTQKFAGFPMFKLATGGDTYPLTSPFTTDFAGLDGLALDLQFAADKTLTARKGPTPVFTRGSMATFVDSDGLIKYGAENLSPSFTSYSKVQLQTPASISDGITADSLRYTPTGTPTGYMFTSFTFVQATLVTLSCFVRSSNLTAINFRDFASPAKNSRNFNPTTGLWAASGGDTQFTSYSVSSFGNGWYRISCNYLPTDATASRFFGVMIGQNAATSVDLGGMQIERFITARTYIPTTTAAVYGPRFDHDPLTGVCKGLLMEEARTNAAWYSGAIVANTGWLLSQVTSVVDGASVDGGTAYLVTEDSSTNTHSVANTGGATGTAATSVVSGTTYTGSIFVKKSPSSVDWVQLTLGSVGFGTAQYANFNLSTGAVGNSAGCTARIEQFSNGWYRCSVSTTAIATTTTSVGLAVFLTNNTNPTTRAPSYAGNTASKILASMCQFETGAFATSYIPTVAASAIRSADTCSISGSSFSGMYNPLEGSFAVSLIFNAPNISSQGQIVFDVNDTTSNNRARVFRYNNTSLIGFNNTINGSNDALITGSTTIITGSVVKLANCIKSNDFALYLNGVLQGTDTSVTLSSTLTTLTIGEVASGAVGKLPLNGTINYLRYYKKRLPDSKLQAFTV